jgi:hypothetical protein
MAWTALALIALLAGVLLTLARRRATAGPGADWVVEPVRLLAPAEQELHAQLRAAFPQHLVLVHVSLARLLRMRRSGGSNRIFQPYLRMAVPFVVCSREFMPLIVVDVHASTDVPRPSRERQKRAAVLQASGLVCLSVGAAAGAVPTADELRQRVRAALQAKGSRAGAGAAPRGAAPPAGPAPRAARPAAVGTAPATAPANRRPTAANPFPKPALVGAGALARPLAAATASVRRLVRPLLARAPEPAQRAKVA